MKMIEDVKTEFKREYVDDIKKAVVAFANTNGGKIYIGVEDDGTPIGVFDIDITMQKSTNLIRDSIKPDITLFVTCSVQNMEEKKVIVIDVQKGTASPYYLSNKGIRPEGVFVRQGASTVPATETAILKMIKETDGEEYEDIRSLNQSLTFEAVKKEFSNVNLEFGKMQMKTLGMIKHDDMYSNLALLLSEQCVHSIKLAIFEGTEKVIFKDRSEFEGSILSQLNEAFREIKRYNRTRAEFGEVYRVDMKDYPVEAIRETLFNALVHRDYAFSGSILISIFDDRIELVSLGGLVKGIAYNDIMLGASILRNKKLANVFYRLKMIEAYGTGMPKIMSSYRAFSIKPKIEVSDNAFKITLPNTNFNKGTNINKATAFTENESEVMSLFEKKKIITRKDIEDNLNISQTLAVRTLKQLIKKDAVNRIGEGKNTRYRRN